MSAYTTVHLAHVQAFLNKLIIIIIIIIYSIYRALIPNGPKALYIIKTRVSKR